MADLTTQLQLHHQIQGLSESQDRDYVRLVHSVHATLGDSPADYRMADSESGPRSAFLSRHPGDALDWICRHSDQKQLLKVVRGWYRRPQPTRREASVVDQSGGDDVEVARSDAEQGGGTDGETSDTSRGQKRKRGDRGTNTVRANRAMADRFNQSLARAMASSQDWEVAAKGEVVGVQMEERAYLQFVQKMPGIGMDLAAAMVGKAAAIGSTHVLRDWRSVLELWRAQHSNGIGLFADAIGRVNEESGFDDDEANGHWSPTDDGFLPNPRRLPPSQREPSASLTQDGDVAQEPPICALETDVFRSLYFGSHRGEAAGIVGQMRYRHIMALLYNEYTRVEKVARSRSSGSQRGRGYNTVAKELLFGFTYRDRLEAPITRRNYPLEWAKFSRSIEYGKRWAAMRSRFGVGIFALLPYTAISNSFVERQLSTQKLFTHWLDMVAECNKGIYDVANTAAPMFLDCMRGAAPPALMMWEELTDEDLAHSMTIDWLREGVPPSQVHEIADSEEEMEGSVN